MESLEKVFKKHFQKEPIKIFSPGRINLIGEHTDYNNGFVLPAAINKGIFALIQKNQTNQCTIIADDLAEKYSFDIQKIEIQENGGWRNYCIGIIIELQKTRKLIQGFDLVFGGDIPLGAGLSSSAALENSIVYGLNEIYDLKLTKREMIFISQKAEQNAVGVQCGIMDQYASMFGEEKNVLLLDCQTIKSKIVAIDFLEYELILINTNVKHNLADSAYNNRRETCERVAKKLKKDTLRNVTINDLEKNKTILTIEEYQKAKYVIEENERVLDSVEHIKKDELKKVGALMYDSHEGLQKQYNVSCPELDLLVEETKKHKEIIGARMMGGGFGGCTINIIKKDIKNKVIGTITKEYENRFRKKCSVYKIEIGKGTRIIN